MNYTVKQGQSIFDVAILAYQDASNIVALLKDNPDISINDDLTGIEVEFTPSVVTQKEVIKTVKEVKANVTINSSQSVFDIALQYYGSAENVVRFLKENRAVDNINGDPTGISLNYQLNNEFVPKFYRRNFYTLATKSSSTGLAYRVTDDGTFRVTNGGIYRVVSI